MSKQKQKAANSDLVTKKPLTPPLIVAGSSDQEVADEIGSSKHTVLGQQKRDKSLMEELGKAKAALRQAQLAALSKVVDTAFTGWTIKTQKQE